MYTTRQPSKTNFVIKSWTCCKTSSFAVRGILAAGSISCAVDLNSEKGVVCNCHHELNPVAGWQSPFLG